MKTITPPVFFRESRTEKLTFTGGKPDAATRKALREAGFRWNGTQWWRNVNATVVIKPKELAKLLAPIAANNNFPQPELATA